MERKIKVYWLVIIMTITLSVFVFIQTCNTDNNLVQYLGFAGSIISLVLGLIAIFYSIVTNQQSTENFGKLKEAVVKIEEGAKIISEVSENINSKLDRISDDLVKFGTKGNEHQSTPKSNMRSERERIPDPSSELPDEINTQEDTQDNSQENSEIKNG